jgi:hypothetical protein
MRLAEIDAALVAETMMIRSKLFISGACGYLEMKSETAAASGPPTIALIQRSRAPG